MQKSTYCHMLERMKKDFIATKIKSSELETSLKSKAGILDTEKSKVSKTKEERLQAKVIFENLLKNIEKEYKDRQDRILELQKCIKNKEESVQRRIERQRRNMEIAEAAANENKDSSELKMRENLYIQKLWNTFMRKKMEKEMRKSAEIDDAFKAIKTATGVTDVQSMVSKFLNREQTYSHLLLTVNESEGKIEKLQAANEELRTRLHELRIDSDASVTDASKKNPADSQDADIIQMNAELSNIYKEFNQLGDRFKRINIVNDQITNWAKRVYHKFGVLTEDPAYTQSNLNMVDMFSLMNDIVQKELAGIKARREEEGEPDHEYAEVFNNIADNDDYFAKNIRVRPVSGITHGDETKDGR